MKPDKVAILVKKAALEFDKIANPLLEKYDLSSAQYKVIKYICSEYENGIRLVDLERYFSMTHPTAIGLVRNLENKGYAQYRPNPEHARSRLIYPSEKALAISDELDKVGDELEDMITRNLSEQEKKELVQLLKKMLEIDNGSQ